MSAGFKGEAGGARAHAFRRTVLIPSPERTTVGMRRMLHSVEQNRMRSSQVGAVVEDLRNVNVTMAGNDSDALFSGFGAFDACFPAPALCGFTDGSLLLVGNRVRAFDGISVMGTFHGEVRCGVLANATTPDVSHGGSGVVLGAGTRDCIVAASGSVKDLGTNNHVLSR